MYKDFHKKEAEKFQNENDCYIHIEMKDGATEQYVAGNALACMWCIMLMINRLSFETDNTFDASLGVLLEMYEDYVEMITG